MKQIYISVSDVAGFIGSHQYQARDDVMKKVLAQNTGGTIKTPKIPIEVNNLINYCVNTDINIEDQIIESSDGLKFTYIETKPTNKTESPFKEIHTQPEKIVIQKGEKEKFISHIDTEISKRKGIKTENIALTDFENELNTKIIKPNYKYKYLNNGKYTVKLGGIADGILKDGTLVEIKSRRNHYFNNIPLYEKIQMECYLFLYNTNKSYWVQRFNDKNMTGLYNKEPNFWEDIEKQLFESVEILISKKDQLISND